MKVTEFFLGFGPALVVPPGRDRVRHQADPGRRLRADHRDEQPRRGRARGRAPHLPPADLPPPDARGHRPARRCTSSGLRAVPGRPHHGGGAGDSVTGRRRARPGAPVQVQGRHQGGAAAKAGVQPGDEIVTHRRHAGSGRSTTWAPLVQPHAGDRRAGRRAAQRARQVDAAGDPRPHQGPSAKVGQLGVGVQTENLPGVSGRAPSTAWCRRASTGTWIGQTVKGLGTFVTGGLGALRRPGRAGRPGRHQGPVVSSNAPSSRDRHDARLERPRPDRLVSIVRRGPHRRPRPARTARALPAAPRLRQHLPRRLQPRAAAARSTAATRPSPSTSASARSRRPPVLDRRGPAAAARPTPWCSCCRS